MRRIVIREVFKDDFITRTAGEKLRQLIESAYSAEEPVELDFGNLTVASISFFDEGIAKLQESGWDSARLKQFVKLKNIRPEDKKVLQSVWDLALRKK